MNHPVNEDPQDAQAAGHDLRLPRGIPAASLKRGEAARKLTAVEFVFRGEYPRPH